MDWCLLGTKPSEIEKLSEASLFSICRFIVIIIHSGIDVSLTAKKFNRLPEEGKTIITISLMTVSFLGACPQTIPTAVLQPSMQMLQRPFLHKKPMYQRESKPLKGAYTSPSQGQATRANHTQWLPASASYEGKTSPLNTVQLGSSYGCVTKWDGI